MAFKNFRMWRNHLPHWRADEVIYYVTFRHRRPLEEPERRTLLSNIIRQEERLWNIALAAVLPENTYLIFSVSRNGFDFSKGLEKVKAKAGKSIIKASGERFPPFYTESFDRIIRDDEELETLTNTIFEHPVSEGLTEIGEEYEFLYVPV